ncbi:hypothetical protein N356_gp011 [Cellulophaga phage phi14:2]|uniref:Uncharacterized protein n=1 Tax=Cellulophaga phage phi14:2 TaxID=1327990 RepID=S0A0J8_9CAUD|nr:hypothetical protein N356_gp011 [Cellulophaga phage phi14:2]AGO48901.1 hypothetical protein Phi14:2_gp023 [Cellulophaga phage phi14:2]
MVQTLTSPVKNNFNPNLGIAVDARNRVTNAFLVGSSNPEKAFSIKHGYTYKTTVFKTM